MAISTARAFFCPIFAFVDIPSERTLPLVMPSLGRELFYPANVLSLLRLVLAPVVVWTLTLPPPKGIWLAIVLFLVAAISDWLDGWLARKLNQVTRLGVALDPIADKVFAGVIVIGLLIYRDLPWWFVVVVIGRDLVILIAAGLVVKDRPVTLPANLAGKYAFGFIAGVLFCYVIDFRFGIQLLMPISLGLIALSLYSYTRVWLDVRAGQDQGMSRPTPRGARWRIAGMAVLTVILVIGMLIEYGVITTPF